MIDWLPSVHQYDQGSFSPNKIDEKLEEGVDCERLILVSQLSLFERAIHTSYISRTGSNQNAALRDMMLVHDAAE